MRQAELFATNELAGEAVPVPGFSLRKDYIRAGDERTLLAHIDAQQWETDWRPRIQQYGLGYAGDHGRTAIWLRDLPPWLVPLAERVARDAPLERFPENCVINEYVPPLGIGPHRDYGAFGSTIACVSLGSDIVLDLTHPERHLKVPVHVPARSLWVLTGEARTEWLHGIASRLTDVIAGQKRNRERRVSVTFRTAAKPL